MACYRLQRPLSRSARAHSLPSRLAPAAHPASFLAGHAGETLHWPRMKLLAFLTEVFLQAFQITRPKPHQERVAQIIIGGLMLLCGFVAVGALVWMLRS